MELVREQVRERVQHYLRDHHPDLLLSLLEENRLEAWVEESVAEAGELVDARPAGGYSPFEAEEGCFDAVVRAIGPSRYRYLHALLEEAFPTVFDRLQEKGVLTTELINMIAACDPVFDEMEFCEERCEDVYLRYAVRGAVHEYLSATV